MSCEAIYRSGTSLELLFNSFISSRTLRGGLVVGAWWLSSGLEIKEDRYGSQTRLIARSKALVAVDNEVHVPGVGQMMVETSILYPALITPNREENPAQEVRTVRTAT